MEMEVSSIDTSKVQSQMNSPPNKDSGAKSDPAVATPSFQVTINEDRSVAQQRQPSACVRRSVAMIALLRSFNNMECSSFFTLDPNSPRGSLNVPESNVQFARSSTPAVQSTSPNRELSTLLGSPITEGVHADKQGEGFLPPSVDLNKSHINLSQSGMLDAPKQSLDITTPLKMPVKKRRPRSSRKHLESKFKAVWNDACKQDNAIHSPAAPSPKKKSDRLAALRDISNNIAVARLQAAQKRGQQMNPGARGDRKRAKAKNRPTNGEKKPVGRKFAVFEDNRESKRIGGVLNDIRRAPRVFTL